MAKQVRGPAPTLSAKQFELVVTMCAHGPYPIRDAAILYMSFKTGLRAKELAGLQIGDLLDENGKLREEIPLRPEITKGKKFGTIYLMNRDARRAVQCCIDDAFAAKAPIDRALFLNRWGKPFNGNTMQKLLRNVYDRAGIKASSHSGRRSFATGVEQRDGSLKVVQQLMRLNSVQQAAAYVDTSPERLKRVARTI